MAKKASIYAAVTLVLLGALFAGGYWLMQSRSEMTCGFCHRNINQRSRVVAEVGGRRKTVCCAHCAVSEGLQEKKPVHLISVTDYNSGKMMDPERAWYVEGSRVMACEHEPAKFDASKHAAHLAYDRCSPGTFAFASKQEAEGFIAENGGALRSHSQLIGEVQK
jgi:hypothetical protein